MINFKVGIMGAGKIAGVIADTLKDLDAFEAYAIASRDTEKAAAFAKEHGVTKYYGSYEELVADPDVELIYIATPHSHHAEHAKLCLNAGKPVLVVLRRSNVDSFHANVPTDGRVHPEGCDWTCEQHYLFPRLFPFERRTADQAGACRWCTA